MRFTDRTDAGRCLADRLAGCAGRPDLVVLALPRGGVPVAYEVADRLGAPLDIFLVRKLGVPGRRRTGHGRHFRRRRQVLGVELIRELGIPDALVRQAAIANGSSSIGATPSFAKAAG